MSGFVVAPFSMAARVDADDLVRFAAWMSFAPCSAPSFVDGPWGKAVVVRVDETELWGPAFDPASGTQLLLGGRVAFDEADWIRARALPYQGGYAARLLLDLWLNRRPECPGAFNGAFAIVIVEDAGRTVHLFTDRLGVYPVYRPRQGPPLLCTHADVLADVMSGQGMPTTLDYESVAEVVGTGTMSPPHTYYREIEELAPATHHVWSVGPDVVRYNAEAYWRPHHLDNEPSTDWDAMEVALAEALQRAVRRRTHALLGKAMVFLSAGTDSRSLLFAAQDPSGIECITVFDVANSEVTGAQQLAGAAGASHLLLQRTVDYYGSHAAETSRICAGMFSCDSGHFIGFLPEIYRQNPGVVLSGCMADVLFKGGALNRRNRTIAGRALPIYTPSPYSHTFYKAHLPLRAKWQSAVQDRLETRYPPELRRSDERSRLMVEDRRNRPLSREADNAGRAELLRCLPWDHVLSDTGVVELSGQMSVGMKVSGILFGRAVGRVVGQRGLRVPNTNYSAPVNASEAGRVAHFLKSVATRKIKRRLGIAPTLPPHATSGSWPEFGHLIEHSMSFATAWKQAEPAGRDIMSDILGFDPWSRPLSHWGQGNPEIFLRILTVAQWLRQRDLSRS